MDASRGSLKITNGIQGGFMKARRFTMLWLTSMTLLFATKAMSLNIVDASYDRNTDEIVFTVLYRGTHPHSFSVAWGECRRMSDGHQEILGIVQPSDPRDAAETDFEQRVRISMTDFPCRPATVFIGAGDPHYRRGIALPGAD